MYNGWPCVKKDANDDTVSFDEKLKFDIVTGKSNRADAIIAGITPAVLFYFPFVS